MKINVKGLNSSELLLALARFGQFAPVQFEGDFADMTEYDARNGPEAGAEVVAILRIGARLETS